MAGLTNAEAQATLDVRFPGRSYSLRLVVPGDNDLPLGSVTLT